MNKFICNRDVSSLIVGYLSLEEVVLAVSGLNRHFNELANEVEQAYYRQLLQWVTRDFAADYRKIDDAPLPSGACADMSRPYTDNELYDCLGYKKLICPLTVRPVSFNSVQQRVVELRLQDRVDTARRLSRFSRLAEIIECQLLLLGEAYAYERICGCMRKVEALIGKGLCTICFPTESLNFSCWCRDQREEARCVAIISRVLYRRSEQTNLQSIYINQFREFMRAKRYNIIERGKVS